MVAKYGIDTGDWSDPGIWSLTFGGVGGAGKPGVGETAVLDSESGPIVLDEASAALGGFISTGYTQKLTVSNALDIVGDAIFGAHALEGTAGISVTKNILGWAINDISSYTGSLTHDGIIDAAYTLVATTPLPDFVVDNAVTSLTLSQATTFRSLTLTAGAFGDGTFDIDVEGDFIRTACILTKTGIWSQTGSGDVEGTIPGHVRLAWGAGVVSTVTSTAQYKEFSAGAGTVILRGTLRVAAEAGSDFWHSSADTTFTSPSWAVCQWAGITGGRTQGEFTINGAHLYIQVDPDGTLTATGKWVVSENVVIRANAVGVGTVTLGADGLECTNLTLGRTTDTNYSGILNAGSGILKVAGNIAGGHATNAANALHMDSCYLELSGDLDAALLAAMSNTAAHVVVPPGASATITDVDPGAGEPLHFYGDVTAAGTCDHYDINEHAHPSSLALMGIGI